MNGMKLGPGQVVTATFSDGRDHRTQDCIDNECFCDCHEGAPMPAGTYITVRLDDPDAQVGLARVTVDLEDSE